MSHSIDEKATMAPPPEDVVAKQSNDVSSPLKDEFDNTKTEVFVFGDVDPALDRKMHLLNNVRTCHISGCPSSF